MGKNLNGYFSKKINKWKKYMKRCFKSSEKRNQNQNPREGLPGGFDFDFRFLTKASFSLTLPFVYLL